MGDTIMGRMGEMDTRMGELERSIADLMEQADLQPAVVPAIESKGSNTSANSSNKQQSQKKNKSFEI
jgi:3,4-dihydroxy-2-butanone 4-phosphate synthase